MAKVAMSPGLQRLPAASGVPDGQDPYPPGAGRGWELFRRYFLKKLRATITTATIETKQENIERTIEFTQWMC